MAKQIRVAGSVLSQYRHVCGFFANKEEEYRVLLPFIKEGLEQGDRAFHIVDGGRHSDHLRRLEEGGVDVAAAERNQQLEIRHWDETYLKDGHFDQSRQLALIESLMAESKLNGAPTKRIMGGADWVMSGAPGVHDLIEYESRLNYLVSKYEDVVCCIYDLSRISASVVMDALRVHPMVILGGILQENPFYVPPDEFLREIHAR